MNEGFKIPKQINQIESEAGKEGEIKGDEAGIETFLSSDLFPRFDLSSEDERSALENSAERVEILGRSFENTRRVVRDLYDREVVSGRVDHHAYEAEKHKRIASQFYTKVSELLTRHGFGDLDLGELGIKPDSMEDDFFYRLSGPLRREQDNLLSSAKWDAAQKVNMALETEGRFEDLVMPSIEQVENDETFKAEYIKQWEAKVKQETETIIAAKGKSLLENWREEFYQLQNEVDEFLGKLARQLSLFDFRVKRTTKEVTSDLTASVENVKSTAFLSINTNPNGLAKVLEAGRYKNLSGLNEEEREAHFSSETVDYLKLRETNERELGILNPDDPRVYGAVASRLNRDQSHGGSEDKYGAAKMYGDIFFKLKPTLIPRSSFTVGDSMFSSNPAKHQIAPEHMFLAKAVINMDEERNLALGGGGRGPMDYLEAQIPAVTADDIESINIPKEVYDNQTVRVHSYANGMVVEGGNPKQVIDKLKDDPHWKDKIRIIP